jgi:hypothetical protein
MVLADGGSVAGREDIDADTALRKIFRKRECP